MVDFWFIVVGWCFTLVGAKYALARSMGFIADVESSQLSVMGG
tara:strand:- start:510 stop:638 length:129 start_codon:yes stop_codon:yes gene_type:complete